MERVILGIKFLLAWFQPDGLDLPIGEYCGKSYAEFIDKDLLRA